LSLLANRSGNVKLVSGFYELPGHNLITNKFFLKVIKSKFPVNPSKSISPGSQFPRTKVPINAP